MWRQLVLYVIKHHRLVKFKELLVGASGPANQHLARQRGSWLTGVGGEYSTDS